MSIIEAVRPTVKTTAIIFAPAFTRRLQNPAFGAGLVVQKPTRLPVGPSASNLQWAAHNLNTTADASDDEWAAEFEMRTMSATDYRAMLADASDAMIERYTNANEAEFTEIGMSPMAEVEVTTAARKPRTLHQAAVAARRAVTVENRQFDRMASEARDMARCEAGYASV